MTFCMNEYALFSMQCRLRSLFASPSHHLMSHPHVCLCSRRLSLLAMHRFVTLPRWCRQTRRTRLHIIGQTIDSLAIAPPLMTRCRLPSLVHNQESHQQPQQPQQPRQQQQPQPLAHISFDSDPAAFSVPFCTLTSAHKIQTQ